MQNTIEPDTILVVKDEKAKSIANKYIYLSVGVALIPVPFLDLAGVFALQVKMLYDLSNEYNVAFSKGRVKSLIASLVGGAVPTTIGGVLGSMAKSIPYVGTTFGVITVPIFCGASTYALSRVFIQHFASGGTFLDFDPNEVREFFRSEFESGRALARQAAAEMKKTVEHAVTSEPHSATVTPVTPVAPIAPVVTAETVEAEKAAIVLAAEKTVTAHAAEKAVAAKK